MFKRIQQDWAKLGISSYGTVNDHSRKHFPDGFWDFWQAIEYGLNPYDFNHAEFYQLQDEAREREEERSRAALARLEEERRRNPRPPETSYRIVRVERVNDRTRNLALFARFGKAWTPGTKSRNLPVFDAYLKDILTGLPVSKR